MFFEILVEFGLPVAAASTMGVFIYIIVKSLHGIIMGLDNRIQTMNNDLLKLDILVSHALKIKPDEERIARADGKDDARKD